MMHKKLAAECPECGRTDKIQIEVRLWVNLLGDDFEIVDESYDAVFNPTPEDGAACIACDWRGPIHKLEHSE